jgi:thiamine-phosphate pyrophosphorylase
MTGTTGGNQSIYQVIYHCLEAASRFVPGSKLHVPALQDLRDVLSAVPTPSESAEASGPPATPSDAIALVAFAQNSLSLQAGSSNLPLDGETAGRVIRILAELEEQLGVAVRRERAGLVRGLYVIIDPQITSGRDTFEIAQAAVRGGASMLQLRDKLTDKGDSLPLARSLQKLCQEAGASLIINDHADVAAIVGSAGLHVGQTDLPVAEARKVLGHQQVIGRSNHEIWEIPESEEMGADHVAFGPIYHTGSKDVGYDPQGMDRLKLARETAKTPLVAIGGINAENVAPVIEAGADAICVTAAVGSASEPEAAAARLVKMIEDAGGRT